MLKSLSSGRLAVPLADVGAVRVQGADALRFLQGQLSNDTQQLTATRSQLAGLHSAQGRVIALLRLMLVGPDEVLAVLPRELAAPVAARLAKYVLRAKAKVTEASADWKMHGLMTETPAEASGAGDASVGALPTELNAQVQDGTSFIVRVAPDQWLAASPVSATAPVAGADDASLRERWRARDIANGIPQVYAATSEAFVAQMLNLDVLGAIAFDKGCYTGQEIIARAHYRGRVKRRMQRFRSVALASLSEGDALKLHDGRSAQVVHSVQMPDGRCEFLAVAPTGAADETSEASVATGDFRVEPLSLPYDLPA